VPSTIGILYPGHAAEDDYPVLESLLRAGVRLPVVHTEMAEDAHRADALRAVGAAGPLTQGAELARPLGVDALLWACTSGSFVFGWDGAATQAEQLGAVLGVPASSTSFAFVHAARQLGVRRAAVAATYPVDLAGYFVDFLTAGGLEVVALSCRGIYTAAEVGTLGRDAVLEFAAANDHPDADALLLPDTALHTAGWLDDLEDRVGKPVLTANQVSVWEGLRLAGALPGDTGFAAGLGSLFRGRRS